MTEVYAVAEAIIDDQVASASQVCELLEVSRSAYYAWRDASVTNREDRDTHLVPLIRGIFLRHRRRYGARRIASELNDAGHTCSPRRVAKLLKIQGLMAIQPKSYKPRTTESRHRLGYSPNLLLECEEIVAIRQILVGDITYIPIHGGKFSYLATLMDRYSRRVIGWQLDTDMSESLVMETLRNSLRHCSSTEGVIHHTDRGGQYASTRYRGMLRRAGIRQSMSRPDNCYDNAFMESCFGTLKTELEISEYESHRAAHRDIAEYMTYYNTHRKHSALGYLTPIQFENLQACPK